MTPAGAGRAGHALAHAGAAVHGHREVAAVVGEREPEPFAAAGWAPRGRGAGRTRMSASSGRGRTSTPGFSTPAGSNASLTRPNSSMAAAEYITGSSSLRVRPSPCSPDSDPP